MIPEVRTWTRAEDIAAIHVELNRVGWLEIADPPKWDPRNRETADHSLAYEIARALVDGEIWIDSFEPGKLMDPAVRGADGQDHGVGEPRCTATTARCG